MWDMKWEIKMKTTLRYLRLPSGFFLLLLSASTFSYALFVCLCFISFVLLHLRLPPPEVVVAFCCCRCFSCYCRCLSVKVLWEDDVIEAPMLTGKLPHSISVRVCAFACVFVCNGFIGLASKSREYALTNVCICICMLEIHTYVYNWRAIRRPKHRMCLPQPYMHTYIQACTHMYVCGWRQIK